MVLKTDELDDIEFLDDLSPRREIDTDKTENDRYRALKLLSICFRWIALVSGVGVAVGILALLISGFLSGNSGTLDNAVWKSMLYFLGGGFLILVQLSISEIIILFIDIEKNTRKI